MGSPGQLNSTMATTLFIELAQSRIANCVLGVFAPRAAGYLEKHGSSRDKADREQPSKVSNQGRSGTEQGYDQRRDRNAYDQEQG